MIEGNFFALLSQGGVAIYPLVLASIVAVGLIIERAVALTRAARELRRLHRLVVGSIAEGSVSDALALVRHDFSFAADVYRESLAAADVDSETRARRVHGCLGRATRELKRFVWLVGTIGSLSPFIGLLGTVFGIVRSFEHMAASGSGGFAVVAAGISEALIATAGGLLVGVVSIFAYNALMVRIGNLSAELRENSDELSFRLEQISRPEGSVPRVVPAH